MDITLIAAVGAYSNVIGKNGELPWPRLAEDFAHFKKRTLGKPCIMGRKTAESIMKKMGGRRLLPDRTNIIMTHGCRLYDHPDAYCAESVEEALVHAQEHLNGQKEIMVIGGAEIYRLFLPRANKLVLTIVNGDFEGDTFFPTLTEGVWALCEELTKSFPPGKGTPSFRIETYIRF